MSEPEWLEIPLFLRRPENMTDEEKTRLRSLSEPKADLDRVVMPRSLTAENGAKSLLIGEFSETVTIECSACNFDFPQDDCEVCGGTGDYTEQIPVSWTTIKEIYAMAVKNLAV